MAEQTDPPSQPQPTPESGEPQRPVGVDTLAEAQALAALDELIAKVDSVGEASNGSAASARPERQEPLPEAYALTGDVPPMDGWYVAMKDNAQGPLTVDDLKDRWARGEIGAETLCWREGMSEWRPLSRLHSLTTAIVPRPREGLKALSSKPPVRSQPSTFEPRASKLLKALADREEQEVQTDRLVGAVRGPAPATAEAPPQARPPTAPTTPEGPKRVQPPPAVKPPVSSAERDDEDEDEVPRRAAGVSGAKLFFSLFAASVLGGVVGGYVVMLAMPPPPAPEVIHEPMPPEPAPPTLRLPPPPPAAAVQPPSAPAPKVEPPKAAAPAAKVEAKPKPAAKPAEGTGEAETKPPPAPKKQPPPKDPVDKDFQDTFGQ